MNPENIISPDELQKFCKQHHIKRFSIFGSILRGDFHNDSDIDIVIEFEQDKIPGLAFFDMQDELSRLTGRVVDLNTPASLSPYFRDRVLSEAQVLYDAA